MERESSAAKRARLRGTFTPTKTQPNRKQRQAVAAKMVREARDELLLAGCDLLEARKSVVNPNRKPKKPTTLVGALQQ